jgi:protein phosphatase
MFNISAFTNIGTLRAINQDSILVNSEILNSGEVHLENQSSCKCFVADGVGGSNAGEFASNFVLERINLISDLETQNEIELINEHLLSISNSDEKLKGAATTLTGLVIIEENIRVFHAGDSQLWLMRNNMFLKITKDHVLDDLVSNSPITSYFGGNGNYLTLDFKTDIIDFFPNDIFLICSDGLFKSLTLKQVKEILTNEETLQNKGKHLLESSLSHGASDNVSAIIIQKIH